jgi:large subunit ribosomal protein L4
VTVLKAFDLAKTLVVVDEPNPNLELSARNVKNVKVLKAEHLNVFDIVKYNNVIVTQSAVRSIEGVLQS